MTAEQSQPQREPALLRSALILVVMACVATLFASAGALTPCERTAQRAFAACNTDTLEEYQLAVANCLQISDFEQRFDCRAGALEVRAEEREACTEVFEARRDLCDLLDEYRYDPDPLLDPANSFVDPDEIPGTYDPNPVLSLEAGRVNVLRATTEGEESAEIVVALNTDETLEVQGVPCRIVAEIALELEEDGGEYEFTPVEVTFDLFAQTEDGDIVYCGEYTVEYEDGFPVSTDGTFIAGVEFAKAGFLARSAPGIGDADRQEFSLDEAEDYVEYMDLGATPPEEFGGEVEGFECEGGCRQTREGTPLEPDVIEWKYFLPDVGFVLALPFELNDDDEFEWTGEREELVCQGNSLEILETECDLDGAEELLESLCGVAGEYFCND